MRVHYWLNGRGACGGSVGFATDNPALVTCAACKHAAGARLVLAAEWLLLVCAAALVYGLAFLPELVR